MSSGQAIEDKIAPAWMFIRTEQKNCREYIVL